MENLKTLLESQPWEYDDGKRQQIINNMYFTFEEDGSLFDVGNFIFKNDNTVFIKNNDFWGELSAEHVSDEKVVLSGFIVHFERDEIELELTPTTVKDTLPAADSIISASMYGNIDDVKHFLKKGDDINMTNEGGSTALMLACHFQHRELAEFLLQEGADSTLRNSRDRNAMHMAISADSPPLIKLLDEHGLSPIEDDTEENSLAFAIHEHVSVKTIKALIQAGASADDKQASLLNTAMYSYHNGVMNPEENCKIVAYLLDEAGFDIDATDETTMRDMDKGNTALIYASAGGLTNVLKLLIKNKADLHKTNHDGETALDVICRDFNQGNDKRIQEITEILHNAGLTKTKEDIRQEKLASITTLCDQGQGRKAMTLLKEIEDDISQTEFEGNYIIVVSSLSQEAELEEIRKALDLLEALSFRDVLKLDSYVTMSIEFYQLLRDSLPEQSDEDEADKQWAESSITELVEKHIESDTVDKATLLEYLELMERYGRGIGIESEDATPVASKANKCAIKLYDKLTEIDPLEYTEDKCRFLMSVSLGDMEEHYGCLLSLFKLDPDNDHDRLESSLRSEFEQRCIRQEEFKEKNPDRFYHDCSVPRYEFMQVADWHVENNNRKEAEWYYKTCSLDAPMNKTYWNAWFSNSIKDNDISRCYDNALKAVKKIDWNRAHIWNVWVENHKECGTIDEAFRDAYDNLCYVDATYENSFPVYFLLRAGANLNQKNDEGYPYLFKIIRFFNANDFQYIVDNYVDNVDQACDDGRTAFFYYSQIVDRFTEYRDLIQILIAAGANPNVLDSTGETCLFDHIRAGHIDTIKFLLEECGIDKSIVNKEGVNVTQIAEQAGNSEVIELLGG